MGCGAAAGTGKYVPSVSPNQSAWKPIPDQYKSFEEVTLALRKAGLESSQLIIGIDFTGSNEETGKQCFGGLCLHDISNGQNPYEKAIVIIAKVLADFDDDHLIPAYGFGDVRTRNKSVFSFVEDDSPCNGLDAVLERYRQIAPDIQLYGPTSFAALIRQAIKQVRDTNEYHILLIVADGQVNEPEETTLAIVEASNYALSIVMVGVGDGPWHQMEEFDDELPARRFDNFQFVEFEAIFRKYPADKRESAFAVHALMEIPDQYQEIKRMNLLSERGKKSFQEPAPPLGPPNAAANYRCISPISVAYRRSMSLDDFDAQICHKGSVVHSRKTVGNWLTVGGPGQATKFLPISNWPTDASILFEPMPKGSPAMGLHSQR